MPLTERNQLLFGLRDSFENIFFQNFCQKISPECQAIVHKYEGQSSFFFRLLSIVRKMIVAGGAIAVQYAFWYPMQKCNIVKRNVFQIVCFNHCAMF